MIISCINCGKKFDVDSSLIPENGRNIQCGSCDHIWFYKHPEPKKIVTDNVKENFEQIDLKSNKEKNNIKSENPLKSYPEHKDKSKSKSDFNFGRLIANVFSLLIVLIISFIGLIIFLDTFKLPLSNFFPNLELILYNLFETLEDVFLFFKNLMF